jgi:hypothetical protein
MLLSLLRFLLLPILLSPQSLPVVNSMIAAGGTRGSTVSVTLTGTNLMDATLSIDGAGLTVQPVSPNSFNVTIACEAQLGPRSVTIATPTGSTNTCGAKTCRFSVVDPRSWTDVTPTSLTTNVSPGPVVRLLDGRLLVIGGTIEQPGVGPAIRLSSVQIFNPATMHQWNPYWTRQHLFRAHTIV